MASATKRFRLNTTWTDISEGNAFLFCKVEGPGKAFIHYGVGAPASGDVGLALAASDCEGLSIALGAGDGVWARAETGSATDLVVMQREA